MKSQKNFSIGIYTGGVDLETWSSLTTKEKENALQRDWYIRFAFRNPNTGKMERQPNIKKGVNYHKTKSKRLAYLLEIKKALETHLQNGLSPFFENHALQKKSKDTQSIESALLFALKVSAPTKGATTQRDQRLHIKSFLDWLGHNNTQQPIHHIQKHTILDFLNDKLSKTSARTRNNYRASLSSIFSTLEKQMIIDHNFVKDIHKEKIKEKKDRTLTTEQLRAISEYLKTTDSWMLLYLRFVAYNFLRPVEVNRLQIKNINTKEGTLYFQSKTKRAKIKRIPQIFINDIIALNLHQYDPDSYLFTPSNVPGQWNASDNQRRDHFTKRFKKTKDVFNLGAEYGIYSYRHTCITNMFRHMRTVQKKSFHAAIDDLLPITGHTTKEGLSNYIHAIDADLPADWSNMIDIII